MKQVFDVKLRVTTENVDNESADFVKALIRYELINSFFKTVIVEDVKELKITTKKRVSNSMRKMVNRKKAKKSVNL